MSYKNLDLRTTLAVILEASKTQKCIRFNIDIYKYHNDNIHIISSSYF